MVAYKPQKLISHSSGSWNSESGVQHDPVLVTALFCVTSFSLCPHMAEKQVSSLTGLYRDINPICEAFTLMTLSSPRANLLIQLHRRFRFQHTNLGGTQTPSPQNRPNRLSCNTVEGLGLVLIPLRLSVLTMKQSSSCIYLQTSIKIK